MARRTALGYVRLLGYLPPNLAEKYDAYAAKLTERGLPRDSEIMTQAFVAAFTADEQAETDSAEIMARLERIEALLQQILTRNQ